MNGLFEVILTSSGQNWTLTSVFSNDQVNFSTLPTSASWQIRTGVSAGNGGTLVASGDTAATFTPVSQVGGFSYAGPQYQVSAAVPSVVLGPGTYWVAVAPDFAGAVGSQSFLETTSGANAIGTPAGNDGHSFVSNTYPATGNGAYSFTPTTTALAGDGDGPSIDFSLGVVGTTAPVPEPASLGLLVLTGVSVVRRRRR
jgi:hypothetical protein